MEITRDQLEALRAYAESQDFTAFDALYESVMADNGETVYRLAVRWKSVGGVAPAQVPGAWPPESTATIRMTRPIAREDVDDLLRTRATNPADVHVTRDRNASVGWTYLEDYLF